MPSPAHPCTAPPTMGPQSPLDIASLSPKCSYEGQHREPDMRLLLLPAPGAKDRLQKPVDTKKSTEEEQKGTWGKSTEKSPSRVQLLEPIWVHNPTLLPLESAKPRAATAHLPRQGTAADPHRNKHTSGLHTSQFPLRRLCPKMPAGPGVPSFLPSFLPELPPAGSWLSVPQHRGCQLLLSVFPGNSTSWQPRVRDTTQIGERRRPFQRLPHF